MTRKQKHHGVAAILLVAAMMMAGCGPRIFVKPPAEPLWGQQTRAWYAELSKQAQTGDWLVIRGYKKGDHGVVAATNIPLSHVALLDLDKQLVIESNAEGVHKTPLRDFVHHAHRVLLIRPRWWTKERGVEAIKLGHTLVGRPYDWGGLIGAGSKDSYYCSELAVHVYHKHVTPKEHLPRVLEPGQLFLWGQVLWDSRPRN